MSKDKHEDLKNTLIDRPFIVVFYNKDRDTLDFWVHRKTIEEAKLEAEKLILEKNVKAFIVKSVSIIERKNEFNITQISNE